MQSRWSETIKSEFFIVTPGSTCNKNRRGPVPQNSGIHTLSGRKILKIYTLFLEYKSMLLFQNDETSIVLQVFIVLRQYDIENESIYTFHGGKFPK